MKIPITTYPADVDAERQIIGSIMMYESAFNQAASIITPADFSLDSFRKIFECMISISENGTAIEPGAVDQEIIRRGWVEAIGGLSFTSTVTDGLPRLRNIADYVRRVRDKSRARMLVHLAENIQTRIEGFDRADEVLADVQQSIIEIVRHGTVGKTLTMPEICQEALTKLNEIRGRTSSCIGLSTAIKELDELTTGFREKEFYVVGARPGQGKTAWMCQSIRENAKNNRRVSVFSLEVPREQLIYRMSCMETNISVFDTRDPRMLDDSQMNALACAMADISEWPIIIEDSPRLTMKQLSALARLHVSQGAEAIYVDYLQKLKAPGRTDFDRVTAIADGLWELGRSTGVPVIALSQLRRPASKDEPPTMDDLRSSGEIEQNANAVFLLWRPKETDPISQMTHFTEQDQIIIGKQRSGVAGTHIPVRFNGQVGKFEERAI